MQKAFEKEFNIIGSDILEIEMSKMKNEEKRNNVKGVYNTLITDIIKINSDIEKRAVKIREKTNIRSFDSLH